MRIQNNFSANSNKKNTAFKNKLIFDIGASDPRGSLKILVQDNDGKDLFEYKGFLNSSTKGFKNNDDFIKKVANAVDVDHLIKSDIKSLKLKLQNENLSKSEAEKINAKTNELKEKRNILKNQSKEDKKITGFALLLPGTIKGHVALFMANLRKTDKASLTDVKLDDIISEVKKNENVEFAENFKFVPCKDLAGTGIGITRKIVNHEEYGKRFSKGFYAVAVQTGGGFGSVNIKVKNSDNVDIETDECSHDLFHDHKTLTEKRLGKLGASTGSIIENFAQKLGITKEEDIKALIKTGMAQITTQSEIKLNKEKDKDAIKVLEKTGLYKIDDGKTETVTLKVKRNEMYKFNKASEFAVKAYANALTIHAITRINRGANLYILSGPLAMGLNKTIKEKPEIYNAKDLRGLILRLIDKRVGNDVTCNILRKAHGFDVVCDESMSVDNNTSGGALLLADNTSTFARRGEWMTIPIKELADKRG